MHDICSHGSGDPTDTIDYNYCTVNVETLQVCANGGECCIKFK